MSKQDQNQTVVDHHDHNHGDLKGTRLAISILLNLAITIAQVIGGLASGSLSLLSDALHNFSDVVALIISYIAEKLTKKNYTAAQTFGYKRAEIIAALINSVSLIIIAVALVREALLRINEPVSIESSLVMILAGFSILVNGGSVLMLKNDSKENMNMKSAYLHLLTDMITSIAVLAGGLAMYLWQIYWLDSLLSLLIAAYLIYSSLGLLLKTLKVLMQFVPAGLNLQIIQKKVSALTEIKNIHHLHIWQLDDQIIQLEAHVDFVDDLPLSAVQAIINEIRDRLKDKFAINHVTLQPGIDCCENTDLVVKHA